MSDRLELFAPLWRAYVEALAGEEEASRRYLAVAPLRSNALLAIELGIVGWLLKDASAAERALSLLRARFGPDPWQIPQSFVGDVRPAGRWPYPGFAASFIAVAFGDEDAASRLYERWSRIPHPTIST